MNIFNESSLVQVVALPYTVHQFVMTAKTQCPDTAFTALGVWPDGITKETWHEWAVSYAVMMDMADKVGPRLDGQKPTYEIDAQNPDYETCYFKRCNVEEAGIQARQKEDEIKALHI